MQFSCRLTTRRWWRARALSASSSKTTSPCPSGQRNALSTLQTLSSSNTTLKATNSDVEMIAANDRMPQVYSHCFSNTSAPQAEATSATAGTEMKDEYGAMDDSGDTYVFPGDFTLENGQVLPQAQLRYQTYGDLNQSRDNVLVICHALTGNASLHAWWGDLLGPQQPFDTSKYFVVCCNILGSCYGSTSPMSINPNTNKPYLKDFPDVSVQDTVRLQLLMLKEQLKVASIKAVIGGSFGGMQAVEFAVQAGTPQKHTTTRDEQAKHFYDEQGNPFVRSVIPIACGAQHTAWQIAISEVQRQAITRDPAWNSEDPTQATTGLEIARQLGMVSYRTPLGYQGKFGRHLRTDDSPQYGSGANWQVKSYLQYQGKKFLGRFDPVTYVKMTEQMDSHDVTRNRGSTLEQVLGAVEIPALVLGIDSDVLYPISEQEQLAQLLPNAELRVIHSDDGHDGFLLEQDQVGMNIIDFLDHHD